MNRNPHSILFGQDNDISPEKINMRLHFLEDPEPSEKLSEKLIDLFLVFIESKNNFSPVSFGKLKVLIVKLLLTHKIIPMKNNISFGQTLSKKMTANASRNITPPRPPDNLTCTLEKNQDIPDGDISNGDIPYEEILQSIDQNLSENTEDAIIYETIFENTSEIVKMIIDQYVFACLCVWMQNFPQEMMKYAVSLISQINHSYEYDLPLYEISLPALALLIFAENFQLVNEDDSFLEKFNPMQDEVYASIMGITLKDDVFPIENSYKKFVSQCNKCDFIEENDFLWYIKCLYFHFSKFYMLNYLSNNMLIKQACSLLEVVVLKILTYFMIWNLKHYDKICLSQFNIRMHISCLSNLILTTLPSCAPETGITCFLMLLRNSFPPSLLINYIPILIKVSSLNEIIRTDVFKILSYLVYELHDDEYKEDLCDFLVEQDFDNLPFASRMSFLQLLIILLKNNNLKYYPLYSYDQLSQKVLFYTFQSDDKEFIECATSFLYTLLTSFRQYEQTVIATCSFCEMVKSSVQNLLKYHDYQEKINNLYLLLQESDQVYSQQFSSVIHDIYDETLE
ncbi:hypothetical protein TRFO_09004 [Tritrichomonas foetus]|uniref:Uncharacterized protein n=1 Tax=Tritrichomonas foetus TaxID=1144522 RepID=A0A1J4JKR6_9EUKA|nr:hypothetical protein TRFO_09004 [Tritrichomonas foetus]|eukprot:OHS98157.1 hypothetical protein TRFO_09004 [Tritrichomonas foetus]